MPLLGCGNELVLAAAVQQQGPAVSLGGHTHDTHYRNLHYYEAIEGAAINNGGKPGLPAAASGASWLQRPWLGELFVCIICVV